MSQVALTICNSAMFKLGARQVVGFNDGTPEADACKIRYPFCRNLLLRDHTWAFDRRFITLPAMPPSPAPLPTRWTQRHQLPPDAGKLISVKKDDCEVQFEQMGSVIYSNHTPLEVRFGINYTAVDDGVQFPDDFAETLALYLALDTCLLLTQNPGLRQSLEGQYHRRLAQARNNGAVELAAMSVTESDWLAAHDSGIDIDIGARNLAR